MLPVPACLAIALGEFVSSSSSARATAAESTEVRRRLPSSAQEDQFSVIIAIRTEAFGSYITSEILLTLTASRTALEFGSSSGIVAFSGGCAVPSTEPY